MNLLILNKFPDWNKVSADLERHNKLYRNTNVIIHGITNYSYVPMHDTTLTVKYAFKGDEYYVTNNCKFRVNNNNYLVINARKKYESYIDSGQNVESLAVFFSPKFASDAYSSLKNSSEGIQEEILRDGELFTFFEKLYSADNHIVPILNVIRNSILDKTTERSRISELLLILMDNLLTLQNEQFKEINSLEYKKRSTREELYKRLNNAKDYILSCYEKDITLDDLSKVASLESHYLLREFKKYFCTTPHKYLTTIRLKEAGKLLTETLKPVSEVSCLVGFEYLSSFTNLFTKHFRMSPLKYRENNYIKSQY